MVTHRPVQTLPVQVVAIAFLLAGIACATARKPSLATRVLVVPESMMPPSCKEIGAVDVVDGRCSLDSFCDCGAYRQLAEGSPEKALSNSRLAAARMGGNVLWVRQTTSQNAFKTHLEQCCHVTCHRVVAVAFSCDAPSLARERQRVTSGS